MPDTTDMPVLHAPSKRALIDPAIGRPTLMLGAVIAIGTLGYSAIEGWPLWKSFFFTLITITTVGYGDNNISEPAQQFTAVLMLGGIATVSYAASQILQRSISIATHPERRMTQRAAKARNHHIVCGLGRTGQRVIQRLLIDGAEVIALDTDARAVEEARLQGITAIKADATADASLALAHVERAASIAAVTSSDATNAMICLTAKALAPNTPIIARAEDPDATTKLLRAGACEVISPTRHAGDGIAAFMTNRDRPEEITRDAPAESSSNQAA